MLWFLAEKALRGNSWGTTHFAVANCDPLLGCTRNGLSFPRSGKVAQPIFNVELAELLSARPGIALSEGVSTAENSLPSLMPDTVSNSWQYSVHHCPRSAARSSSH